MLNDTHAYFPVPPNSGILARLPSFVFTNAVMPPHYVKSVDSSALFVVASSGPTEAMGSQRFLEAYPAFMVASEAPLTIESTAKVV